MEKIVEIDGDQTITLKPKPIDNTDKIFPLLQEYLGYPVSSLLEGEIFIYES